MSSAFHYKICDSFDDKKSLHEFIDNYCQPDSAEKCLNITIGYVRNTNNTSRIPADITNLIFAFHFGAYTTVHVRYFTTVYTYYDQMITVPMYYSLQDIWTYIQHNLAANISNDHESLKCIDNPMFALCSNSDSPYEISKSADTMKKYFAKILHHKLNPIIVWKECASKLSSILFGEDILLCVENRSNFTPIGQGYSRSNIFYHYRYINKLCKLLIDDYTQVTDKYNDGIGSSHAENVQVRKIILTIPKGTNLEKFLDIVRQLCKVSAHEQVRAFRLYEQERYLYTFPYKFQCEHRLVLEKGRYPRYTEVFLMVCVINTDNTTSEFLPLIIDKSKSVKRLKQNIMILFNLNPLEYKTYMCYNITASVYKKDKYWRDELTLNNRQINVRHCQRIGIERFPENVSNKIAIIKDMRNLNKIWDLSKHSYSNNNINGTNNPYLYQEIGTINIKQCYDMQQVRRIIYNMKQFQNANIKSHKLNCLLLSWLDNEYNVPLSYPMISVQSISERHVSTKQSVICVEILNEEIEFVPNSRFLHIYLAKIEQNETETKDDNNINHDVNIIYWPPDYHIRVIYSEENKEKYGSKSKITYKKLSTFLCKRYSILSQNLLIAMFKTIRGCWMLLNDEADNNKQGLDGFPYNIKKARTHEHIFAIFDLSKCMIKDVNNNEDKIDFIKHNMNTWSSPPLSQKAQLDYNRFNNIETSES